ncbi:MAG TPA: putative molybdenum carrier protein [Salinibacter sp.]|nr:putative molybdenum carrier protein [Salinibacter sp.]
MRLRKIVSGGQTGVDRAALDAGLDHDLPVGGWCPNGRRAEDGSIPDRYPLKETPSDAYEQRTAWNVRDSDGTLIITGGNVEGGTAHTITEANRQGRPVLHVRTSDKVPVPMIRAWGEDHDIRVLNVAGPRASELDGMYEKARAILDSLLDELQPHVSDS